MHPQFKLNNHHFNNSDECLQYAKFLNEEVCHFLTEWFNNQSFVTVKTSGSTGKPKLISLKKELMVNSAKATGNYFNLVENTTALLCMPVQYIAGKMMLVRALVLGWNIEVVEPSSNPLKELDKNFDFCAMVPLQVASSINDLDKIKTILIGGGEVSNSLRMKLQNLETEFYASYGMTETITHIAVQKLNNSETDYFECLPNVKIEIDKRNCLVINAPLITDKEIVTNDLVELISENKFKWLGRFDSVINSGGVKIIPEQVEQIVSTLIENRFFISSEKDELLGEKVILIIESNPFSDERVKSLKKQFKVLLQPYQIPKSIYFVAQFVETDTKKIQRSKTLDLILNR